METTTEPRQPKPRHKFTAELNRKLAKRPRQENNYAVASIKKFQRALLQVVDCLVEEDSNEGPILRGAKPAEIAACATAWDRLQDRRGVLAGHGKPKPVTATNDPGRQEPAKVAPASSEELPDTLPAKFG